MGCEVGGRRVVRGLGSGVREAEKAVVGSGLKRRWNVYEEYSCVSLLAGARVSYRFPIVDRDIAGCMHSPSTSQMEPFPKQW